MRQQTDNCASLSAIIRQAPPAVTISRRLRPPARTSARFVNQSSCGACRDVNTARHGTYSLPSLSAIVRQKYRRRLRSPAVYVPGTHQRQSCQPTILWCVPGLTPPNPLPSSCHPEPPIHLCSPLCSRRQSSGQAGAFGNVLPIAGERALDVERIDRLNCWLAICFRRRGKARVVGKGMVGVQDALLVLPA